MKKDTETNFKRRRTFSGGMRKEVGLNFIGQLRGIVIKSKKQEGQRIAWVTCDYQLILNRWKS